VNADAPHSRFRALLRSHRGAVIALTALALLLVTANVLLAARWWRYRAETARLRAGMSEAERNRADMALQSEQNRVKVMLELVRRQAQGDQGLHLSIAVDSGRMYLERDGVVLREMDITVGPERVVGTAPDTVRLVVPRGTRSVAQVLHAKDAWEVPRWVYADRAQPVPENRTVAGALGSAAIVLSGGAVIYAIPKEGPLADSSYVLPGAVLARAEDLRAIAQNITPGMAVYLYE
jgi:hypothetical protein